MTQTEIIELAKQSGLLDMDYELGDWEIHEFTVFAKLVAAAEREACVTAVSDALYGREGCGKAIAVIRARGKHEAI